MEIVIFAHSEIIYCCKILKRVGVECRFISYNNMIIFKNYDDEKNIQNVKKP